MIFDPTALAAVGQVVLIDLVLAGDNAVVIGMLAAGLPAEQRRKVVLIGVAAALLLRIAFALGVTWLLQVPGLVLLGGILLLWVAWKMWRDLTANTGRSIKGPTAPESFARAVIAVTIADASMSLDNVLGVAGAARAHPWALTFGLILSVALMGGAATVIARYIGRYRWIAFIGLSLILFVAARMLWDGSPDLARISVLMGANAR